MPQAILRLPTVTARTGLSRSTIYARIRTGKFPAAIALGSRAVGWLEAEIDQWITDRVDQTRLDQAKAGVHDVAV